MSNPSLPFPGMVRSDVPPDKQILVYVRMVYGKLLFYPANDVAQVFADLAGVKSLSGREVSLAMRLGYFMFQVPDPKAVSALNKAAAS